MQERLCSFIQSFYPDKFHEELQQKIFAEELKSIISERNDIVVIKVSQGQTEFFQKEDYSIRINQPTKLFFVFGDIIGDFSQNTFISQLTLLIEQKTHQDKQMMLPILKQIELLLQLFQLSNIIINFQNSQKLIDINQIKKFTILVQDKITSNQNLLYVDYGQIFPQISQVIDDSQIVKAYQNCITYQAKKKLKITQNIQITTQLEPLKISSKTKQIMIQIAKIMYIILDQLLLQLVDIENSINFDHKVQSYSQFLNIFQGNQYKLDTMILFIKQSEFLYIFDLLYQYRQISQQQSTSSLPQIKQTWDESVKLIDDLFDCKQTLFIAMDDYQQQLTKTLTLYSSISYSLWLINNPQIKTLMLFQYFKRILQNKKYYQQNCFIQILYEIQHFYSTTLESTVDAILNIKLHLPLTEHEIMVIMQIILNDILSFFIFFQQNLMTFMFQFIDQFKIDYGASLLISQSIKDFQSIEQIDENIKNFYNNQPSCISFLRALLITQSHTFLNYYKTDEEEIFTDYNDQFQAKIIDILGFNILLLDSNQYVPFGPGLFQIFVKISHFSYLTASKLKQLLMQIRQNKLKEVSIKMEQIFKSLQNQINLFENQTLLAVQFVKFLKLVNQYSNLKFLGKFEISLDNQEIGEENEDKRVLHLLDRDSLKSTFSYKVIEENMGFLLEEVDQELLCQFLTTIDYYFVEFHQYTLDFVEKLLQNNSTMRTEKAFQANDLQMSNSLKLFEQSKNLVTNQGTMWIKVQDINQYSNVFGFNLYTQDKDRFEYIQNIITSFNTTIQTSLLNMMKQSLQLKQKLDIQTQLKFLGKISSIIQQKENNIIANEFKNNFNTIVQKLGEQLKNSEIYIINIIKKKQQEFQFVLQSTLESPFNVTNLPSIVLYLSHIYKNIIFINRSVESVHQMIQKFPDNKEFNIIQLKSQDLSNNTNTLLQSFFKLWQQSRITVNFKKTLNDPLLTNVIDMNNQDTQKIESSVNYQLLNKFTFSFNQLAMNLFESSITSINLLFNLKHLQYTIKHPESLFRTSFELTCLSRLQFFKQQKEYQKFVLIAQQAQQIVPTLQKILLHRERILNLLGMQQIFTDMFIYQVIDLEVSLSELSFAITWSSVRAQSYVQDLLDKYFGLFQIIKFTIEKFKQMYKPFLNNVYQDFNQQITEQVKQYASYGNKLSIVQIEVLFIDMVQQHFENIFLSYTSLFQITNFIKTQIKNISSLSLIFYIIISPKQKQFQLLQIINQESLLEYITTFQKYELETNHPYYQFLNESIHLQFVEMIQKEVIKSYCRFVSQFFEFIISQNFYEFIISVVDQNVILTPSVQEIQLQFLALIQKSYKLIFNNKLFNLQFDKFKTFIELHFFQLMIKLQNIINDKLVKSSHIFDLIKINIQNYNKRTSQDDILLQKIYQEKTFNSFQQISQIEEDILFNVQQILLLQKFQSDVENAFQEINWVNTKHIQLSMKLDNYQHQVVHSNIVRISVSKLLQNLELFLQNYYFCNFNLKKYEQLNSYIQSLIYGTDQLEILYQKSSQIDSLVKQNLQQIKKRQYMFFDSQFEYFVQKFYKSDDQFIYNLQQIIDSIKLKYENQKQSLYNLSKNLTKYLLRQCDDIIASYQITYNQYYTNGAVQYFLNEFKYEQLDKLNQILIWTDQKKLFKKTILISQLLDHIIKDQNMKILHLNSQTKYLLGFENETVFLIDNEFNIYIIIQQPSCLTSATVEYLNKNRVNICLNNLQSQDVNFDITIQQIFVNVYEVQINSYYLDFSQLLHQDKIESINQSLLQALELNTSYQFIFQSQQEQIEQLQVLIKIQTIYAVQQSLPIQSLNNIQEFVQQLNTLYKSIYTCNHVIQQFYSLKVQLFFMPLHTQYNQNWYNENIQGENVLDYFIILIKDQISIVHQNLFQFKCSHSQQFVYFLQLIYFIYYSYELIVLQQLEIVGKYKFDLQKQILIPSKKYNLELIGEVIQYLFNLQNYNDTIQNISSYSLSYNQNEKFNELKCQVLDLHSETNTIIQNYLNLSSNSNLIKLSSRIKDYQYQIQQNVNDLQIKNLTHLFQLEENYDTISFELKILEVILASIYNFQDLFDLIKIKQQLEIDLSAYQSLSSFVSNSGQTFENNIYSQYISTIFDYYEQNKKDSLYNIQSLNIKTFTYGDDLYENFLQVPLFQFKLSQNQVIPTINPISHGFYENYVQFTDDYYDIINKYGDSKGLDAQFFGFFSQRQTLFVQELSQSSILQIKSVSQEGAYEMLINQIQSTILIFDSFNNAWVSFVDRFLSQSNFKMLSKKQFPLILSDIKIIQSQYNQAQEQFKSLYKCFSSYYNEMLKLQLNQFQQLFQANIANFVELSSIQHTLLIEKEQTYFRSKEIDIDITETQRINVFSTILGIDIKAILISKQYIIGILLKNNFIIKFKNKILFYMHTKQLSMAFIFNFCKQEILNSFQILRVQAGVKVGLFQSQNFSYLFKKIINVDISNIYFDSVKVLTHLVTQLQKNLQNMILQFTPIQLKGDIMYRYFPQNQIKDQFQQQIMDKLTINYDYIHNLPDGVYFQVIISLLTLNISAYFLSDIQQIQEIYFNEIQNTIKILQKLSQKSGNTQRLYFIQIIQWQILQACDGPLRQQILKIIEDQQIYIQSLQQQPLFSQILYHKLSLIIEDNIQEDSFTEIQFLKIFKSTQFSSETTILGMLEIFENLLRHSFIVHQIAYSITLNLKDTVFMSGYFEKIPSVSFSQYYKLFIFKDQQNTDNSLPIIGQQIQLQHTNNNYPINPQVYFDSPFYKFRPHIYEDEFEIFYQLHSFRMHINLVGKQLLAQTRPQLYKFNNYAAKDFYESLLELSSIFSHDVPLVVGSVNNHTVFLFGSITGKYLLFLDNLEDFNLLQQEFVLFINDQQDLSSFLNTLYINQQNDINYTLVNNQILNSANNNVSMNQIIVQSKTSENFRQSCQFASQERIDFNSLQFKMDFRDYTTKIVATFILKIQQKLATQNYEEVFSKIKILFSNYPRSDIEQLLINLENIQFVYIKLTEYYNDELTLENFVLHFEQLFTFSYLLATCQYNLLIQNLENPNFEFFNSLIQQYREQILLVFGPIQDKQFMDSLIMLYLEISFSQQVRISSKCIYLLEQIVYIVLTIIKQQYYKLIQQNGCYHIITENSAVIIKFDQLGILFSLNNLSRLEQYQFSLKFQQFVILEKQHLEIHGEDFRDQLLLIYYLKKYEKVLDDQQLLFYSRFIQQLVISNKTQTCLVSSLEKSSIFSLQEGIINKEIEPIVSFGKDTADIFSVYNNYINTPQLMVVRQYVLSVVIGWIISGYYNKNVFSITIEDQQITLDQILNQFCFEQLYFKHDFIPVDKYLVYKIFDDDLKNIQLDDILMNEYYGVIIVLITDELEQINQLQNKLLLELNNYILFTISFSDFSQKIKNTNKRLCITNPFNQDLLKIAQLHLVRILQQYKSVSLIFQSKKDTIQYTAQFIRSLFKIYNNTQIILQFTIVLNQFVQTQLTNNKQDLINALEQSYFILKVQYDFKNDNNDILYKNEDQFIYIIAIFFDQLPPDIPLQSYDLEKQQLDQTFSDLFLKQSQQFYQIQWIKKLVDSRYDVAYNEKDKEVQFTYNLSGEFLISLALSNVIKQVYYYYDTFVYQYSIKPLKLINIDKLILSFISQHIMANSKNKLLLQVIDCSNQNKQYYFNQIVVMIQNLQFKLKEQKKNCNQIVNCIVVFQNHTNYSQFNTLLMAFCSNQTYLLFSQNIKNRLKSVLQINQNEIKELVNKFFMPIIQMEDNQIIQRHFYSNNSFASILEIVGSVVPQKYMNMVEQQILSDKQQIEIAYNKQSLFKKYQQNILSYIQNLKLYVLVNKDNLLIDRYQDQKSDYLKQKQLSIDDHVHLKTEYENNMLQLDQTQSRIYQNQLILNQQKEKYNDLIQVIKIKSQKVLYQETQLEELNKHLQNFQRESFSSLKTYQNPPTLVKRALDCLSIIQNIKVDEIQSQIMEIKIEFLDKRTDIYNKPLFIQSTYHSDNIKLDLKIVGCLISSSFKLNEYCYQRGYQVIYTKQQFLPQRLQLMYNELNESDIIYKQNIIQSTILEKDNFKVLMLKYYTPVDSFLTNKQSYKQTEFVPRILSINPSHITNEQIELLQPYMQTPDTNSLTLIQTTEYLFDLQNWISTLLQIKIQFDSYFPTKQILNKLSYQISNLSTDLDKVNVQLCEDQLILENIKTNINQNLESQKEKEKLILQYESLITLQNNKINQIIEYQTQKSQYLEKYCNEVQFLYSNCLDIQDLGLGRNLYLGINIFLQDDVINIPYSDQYLFNIYFEQITPKNYFYSSIIPWLASYLTPYQAIDLIKKFYQPKIIYVQDQENQFQIVIKNLIIQLHILQQNLMQLNYYSKLQPFYQVEQFEIEVFDSLDALGIHGQSYKNSLLFVYISKKELESFSGTVQIFNLLQGSNKIILIGQDDIHNIEEIVTFKFQLFIPLKYIIMSSISIKNSLFTKLQESYVQMYTSLIDYLLCAQETGFDYLESAKENFEADKQIWLIKYGNYHTTLQGYIVFNEICIYLLQISQNRQNNIKQTDIQKLINLYSQQLLTNEKFQEDNNLHEQIQYLIIQDILRFISKEDYVKAYFKVLKKQDISNLYKIFTINFYHHQFTFDHKQYSKQLDSKYKFFDQKCELHYIYILSYFQQLKDKSLQIIFSYLDDEFFKYCIDTSYLLQQGDIKLIDHINYGIRQKYLHENCYVQSIEQALSITLEFIYPEEFISTILQYLKATELEKVQSYINLCFYYMFGFYQQYREMLQNLPTVDYHLPPKQYEYKNPGQLILALRNHIEPNISYILQSQQYNFNEVQQLLLISEPKILQISTLQLLNYSYNLSFAQIKTNQLEYIFKQNRQLQAQIPFSASNQFNVTNKPNKLIQTIMHLDDKILQNFMQLSQTYHDQQLKIMIDSAILPFIPSVLLALCLVIYQSNQSPFIINYYLKQLYIRTTQLFSAQTYNLPDDFLNLVKPAVVSIDGIQIGRMNLSLVIKEQDIKIAMLKSICIEIDPFQIPVNIDNYSLETVTSYQTQWETFLEQLDQCIQISNAQSPRWQSKSQ